MPFVTDRLAQQNGVKLGGPRKGADLARALASSVVGQEAGVDALARAVVVASAGLSEPIRPLANILLVGPTGVGKTELARTLAATLRSGPDDLCRIDMNALAQEHYVASFSGAPPGYAGSKEGFSLFERSKIEGDPYTPGIVLFDEIEKAHPTVLRSLLQILDHGELRLANGQERISFRNCFVLMTSNLGSRQLSRFHHGAIGDFERWAGHQSPRLARASDSVNRTITAKLARRAVKSFFDPEFLNRIDEVVVMNHLSYETARRIVMMQVGEVCRRASKSGLEVSVGADVIDLLQAKGFSAAYGARSVRRAIRRHVATPLAEAVHNSPSGSRVARELHLSVVGGEVHVSEVASQDKIGSSFNEA